MNAAYVRVFVDYQYKSEVLTKKHASALYTYSCPNSAKSTICWTRARPSTGTPGRSNC